MKKLHRKILGAVYLVTLVISCFLLANTHAALALDECTVYLAFIAVDTEGTPVFNQTDATIKYNPNDDYKLRYKLDHCTGISKRAGKVKQIIGTQETSLAEFEINTSDSGNIQKDIPITIATSSLNKPITFNLHLTEGINNATVTDKNLKITLTTNTGQTPPNPPTNTNGTGTQPAPHTPFKLETINNPLKSETFIALAFRIMQLLLGMAAGLAVVFIMVGAAQLMFSQGNPEQVTRGKDTIVWALLGLLIALFAFSMVAIVQNLLLSYFK